MTALRMLLAAYPQAVSGEEIAKELGLSRTGIWKQIQNLQKQGIEIEGRQNSGYRLLSWPDQLRPELLAHYLEGCSLGQTVHYQSTIDSTNRLAKELARQGTPHGTLVTAEEQTAGRGRRGRTWLSGKGTGIYASLILRPVLPARRVPMLTLAVGIAVVEAIQAQGLQAAWLKWPNDVWVGRRKLAGILSELTGEMDQIDYVVVGIGINTHQAEFDAELAETATSFLRESGRTVNRAELMAEALKRLEQVLPLLQQPDLTPLLTAFEQHDRLRGQEVRVITPTEERRGRACGLTPDGTLLIELADGSHWPVLAGDVSLRPAE